MENRFDSLNLSANQEANTTPDFAVDLSRLLPRAFAKAVHTMPGSSKDNPQMAQISQIWF
jgi:hypothetical protein